MEYFVLVNDDGEMQGMSVEGDITDEELWFRATSQCPKVDEVLPLPYAVRAALQVLEYAATEKQLSRHVLDVLMSITETTPPLGVSYKANSDIEVEIEDSDEDKGEPYVYTELVGGGEGEMPVVKWFVYNPSSPLSPIGPFDTADAAKKGLSTLG